MRCRGLVRPRHRRGISSFGPRTPPSPASVCRSRSENGPCQEVERLARSVTDERPAGAPAPAWRHRLRLRPARYGPRRSVGISRRLPVYCSGTFICLPHAQVIRTGMLVDSPLTGGHLPRPRSIHTISVCTIRQQPVGATSRAAPGPGSARRAYFSPAPATGKSVPASPTEMMRWISSVLKPSAIGRTTPGQHDHVVQLADHALEPHPVDHVAAAQVDHLQAAARLGVRAGPAPRRAPGRRTSCRGGAATGRPPRNRPRTPGRADSRGRTPPARTGRRSRSIAAEVAGAGVEQPEPPR